MNRQRPRTPAPRPSGPARTSRPARHALAAAMLAMASLQMDMATAQGAPAPAAFDIAAQPLPDALAQFARQSGVQLIYPPELVQGRHAQPVQGARSPEAALAELLRGSGLRMRRDGATLVVERAPADGAAALPEVRVAAEAEVETATGPVRGLVARRSASATKTDTPLMETPQTITVVTAEQMQVQRVRDLEQAFEYSAGVRPVSGYSGSYDAIYSRGFWADARNGSLFADGLKVSDNSWASGKQEPYGLERVELVKGAASVLYGMSAPGGVLATVSKRPTADAVREVVVEAGTYAHRQIGVDLGGEVAPGSDWTWRLTALARDSETPVRPLQDDAVYIAPALRWQPSAATSLTLLMQHQKRRLGYSYPLPRVGTLLPGPGGQRIARFRFVGEPAYDRQDVRQTTLTALFEHQVNEHATLRQGLRFFDSEADIFFTNATVDPAAPTRVQRRAIDEFERVRGFSSDTSLQQRWRSGEVEHTLIAGVDYTRYRSESEWYARTLAPLDLYQPQYGAVPGAPAPMAFSDTSQRWQAGLYAQDQIKLGERWVVLAGLRHDWSDDRSRPFFTAAPWSVERTDAFTGRVGVVYLAPGGWAPFAGYSQSFQPQGGTDAQGRRFKPTEGEQFELGVRWQPSGSEGMMLSAAVYDLRQDNVLTPDPAHPQFSVQTGQARSRGAELEVRGQVARHLEVVGAYAYTDRRITRSNLPDEVGRRAAEVPYHQASVWGHYRLAAWGLPAWTLGTGLRYTGDMVDGTASAYRIPGYGLVDAMLAWQDGPWRVALNVRNLFDKAFLICNGAHCRDGSPRTATLSAAYRW
ncbi:TonB-dependent siderophore receptor [Acidovorax sp. sif1233]|uniref:TonB-dependent siderophore receptor n=1 Tax=Acidovorax sp. sif1233 TaxID=2854792 RepID=UPI001C48A151|nr:TonB-dependent siderophore receptor [Acidovorax sp. sif1233]MBV7453982.1 TonB-dependent siderophore receptor [Acidovorax sp. sif1233]